MRHYAILSRTFIETELDFSQTSIDSVDTVRWSVDGSRGVIHWEGDTPDGVIAEAMTEDECRDLMLTDEWRRELTEPND
jgi:hypothetical protein